MYNNAKFFPSILLFLHSSLWQWDMLYFISTDFLIIFINPKELRIQEERRIKRLLRWRFHTLKSYPWPNFSKIKRKQPISVEQVWSELRLQSPLKHEIPHCHKQIVPIRSSACVCMHLRALCSRVCTARNYCRRFIRFVFDA